MYWFRRRPVPRPLAFGQGERDERIGEARWTTLRPDTFYLNPPAVGERGGRWAALCDSLPPGGPVTSRPNDGGGGGGVDVGAAGLDDATFDAALCGCLDSRGCLYSRGCLDFGLPRRRRASPAASYVGCPLMAPPTVAGTTLSTTTPCAW